MDCVNLSFVRWFQPAPTGGLPSMHIALAALYLRPCTSVITSYQLTDVDDARYARYPKAAGMGATRGSAVAPRHSALSSVQPVDSNKQARSGAGDSQGAPEDTRIHLKFTHAISRRRGRQPKVPPQGHSRPNHLAELRPIRPDVVTIPPPPGATQGYDPGLGLPLFSHAHRLDLA
eukprot:55966-Eustigmatos_ZCMA.PRE.1